MGSKYEYLLFPGVGMFFFAISLFGKKLTMRNAGNEKTTAISMLSVFVFMFVLFCYFMWKALDPATVLEGMDRLAMRGTFLLLMVLFIVLGNIAPKVRRNAAFGLRTKWSMYSDTCWQKSQRLCGYTMMACGVVGLVLCAVLPDAWIIWGELGLIFAAIPVISVGSYLIYKKEREKEGSENG
jgi:uncharacterized membrane protein